MIDLKVYRTGICCMSVCVPAAATPQEIEEEANIENPTGIDSGWKISPDAEFKTGLPNPCPCELETGRMHYLMNC